MVGVVRSALRDFARWDMDLLHVHVFEATLAHRVAVYIERRLTGWHVDCEYNRNLSAAKMRSDGANGMRPDVVAHVRNSTHNLLFVEIKKASHSPSEKQEARDRVREMTGLWINYPRYPHGAVLIFPVRPIHGNKVICEWYHRNAVAGDAPVTNTLTVSLAPPAGGWPPEG